MSQLYHNMYEPLVSRQDQLTKYIESLKSTQPPQHLFAKAINNQYLQDFLTFIVIILTWSLVFGHIFRENADDNVWNIFRDSLAE